MCINIGVLVISVKIALIDRVALTFDLSTSKPYYFWIWATKVIPYEHIWIIRFSVLLRTNKQTEPNILLTPTEYVGVGKYIERNVLR